MARERKFRYYIEPLDNYTNEALARELAPKFECSERKLWTGRKCQVWEVPDRRFVNYLQKSRRTLKIDFNAFIQEDNYPLRPYPWPLPRKKRLPAKRNAKQR